MNNFKFIQIYLYGDNWDGELINIPDSALFYNVDYYIENQQEWYILIPINDFNEKYEGKGCCQVTHYIFSDYVIIHLKNIIPVGVWNNIDDNTFNEIFGSKFKEWYIYEYKQAQYVLRGNDFVKVEDEVLLNASRVKGLRDNCRVNTTTVYINDNETFGIIQSTQDLYDIDKLIDDEDNLSDDEFKKELLERNEYKVSIRNGRYILITKDSSVYENIFNEIKNKLY